MRSEEWWKGRTKFGSAPIPFYNKGYYSADFFGETFPAIVSIKVIKVIKGYGNTVAA